MVYTIFTQEKSFADPWVGNPTLNKHGLHVKRLEMSQNCVKMRINQTVKKPSKEQKQLIEQGYTTVENFLQQDKFETLLKAAKKAEQESYNKTPLLDNPNKGFCGKQSHEWGFDRYDGGTLNRFINDIPEIELLFEDGRLDNLCRAVIGLPRPRVNQLYITVHGDQESNKDNQKYFHRDSFFPAVKYWYFLKEVREEDGPFIYIPESHKLTRKRKDWEHEKALGYATRNADAGAFRIKEEECQTMGLPQPKAMAVPANTLVIANTFGFHRRGDATKGQSRLAIYGHRRPSPFGMIGK